ncbi:MFS transporter [Hamadaea sp. NPDC051192]|uniref:MFS transporter n=1 Tax=Hamadaea sp. NPDC051192 TaxID=3154940 RepID=UPI00343D4E8F
MAAFTVTSALCALADGVWWLVAARVSQGLSAGLLLPAGQTILGQAVGPQRLGRVMATLGIAVSLGPALGPVAGGLIIHNGSWPWLFLVNLPLGGIALYLGWRFVPRERPDAHPGRLDWPGLLLVSAGVPLLVYGLTAWGEQGSLATLGSGGPVTLGALLLVTFVWYARRTVRPVLDLRLFANRAYAAATATGAVMGATMFGATLLFPLYFQIGRGAGVLETGVALIPLGLGTAVALPISGRLLDRIGGGLVSLVGGLGTAASTVPFALAGTELPTPAVLGLLFLRGVGIAFAVGPASIAAFKAVTTAQLPDATTQVNIAQRVGGALGGAVFAVLLATRLPGGVDAAFRQTFWWLTAASALGLATAAWLTVAEHSRAARRSGVDATRLPEGVHGRSSRG